MEGEVVLVTAMEGAGMDTKMWTRRQFGAVGSVLGMASMVSPALAATSPERVEIDLRKETGPLDHIWRRCIGSDRAAITLRENWRRDLDRCSGELGTQRVRFHGIFADELGIGTGLNFQNVNAVYDGLLDRGVQPFVELSFMPTRLASGTKTFGFYKANVTPPVSMKAWSEFVTKFVQHLVRRYGIAEVRQWYFEV